ncbi:Mpd1 [Kluyveromyces lactis]|nr:Mpd1 [Kluyveromyces lactis]
MMYTRLLYALFLLVELAFGANFYDRDENIMELTPSNFDRVIHRTNYTTLVMFYAPWCGYCQELKSSMKSAGKILSGMVQVAGVNCDESVNKQLCAQNRVSGFPTLMVFRPPKINLDNPKKNVNGAASQHATEVYKGERKLKPIVDFALSRVKNYVKRLNRYSKFEELLKSSRTKYAVVLVSKKEKIPTLYKSVALDWLGIYDFYSIWDEKLQDVSQLSFENDTKNWPNTVKYLQSLEKSETELQSPRIVVIDRETDTYEELDILKSTDKTDIAAFLSKFESKPREGPLSKRQEYLKSILNKSKSKKSKTKKNKQKTKLTKDHIVQDEL